MTEEEKKRIKEEEKLLNEQSDPSSAAAETPKVEEEPKADIEPAVVTAEASVKPAAPAATAETAAEVVATPAPIEAAKEEVNEMYDTARARGAEQPQAVATPAPAVPATPAQPVAAPAAPATPAAPTTTPSITQQIKATADKVAPVGQLNPNLLPDKNKTIETVNDLNDRSEDAAILGTMAKGQREVVNAYDDLMKATANINARQEAELRDIEAGDSRAARWASIGEAVAAFGNSIAVASGASHQQYKPVSQDWMRQADASRRERMKTVASMEQNLAQQRARIAEMKQRGSDALIDAKMKLQDRRLKNRLTELQMRREEAYADYYEAQSAKAAAEAKGKIDLYAAQIREIESRINRNNTYADATATKAAASASEAANRNANRDSRTAKQNEKDDSTINLNNTKAANVGNSSKPSGSKPASGNGEEKKKTHHDEFK